jgi:hypothetical protein
MKAHIFEDHFLNKVIESETARRPAADHHNGIRPHLKGFDKISQDNFKRETDTLIRVEDTEGQGLATGFRRKDVRNAGGLCDRLAEDVH